MQKRFEQAVILAGGRGERLRPLTDTVPKPMALVNGRPFLDYLIKSLISTGIKRILILVGYRADKIMDFYGDSFPDGTPVEYSIGSEDDQTGRRLLNAYIKLNDFFLLLYGDNYWQPPLEEMVRNYDSLGTPVTTTIFSNIIGTGEYGYENNICIGPRKIVQMYDKTRQAKELNGVDIGFFLIDKRILNPKTTGNVSFEENILLELVKNKQVGGFITDDQYYYITSIDSLSKFEVAANERKFPYLDHKQ